MVGRVVLLAVAVACSGVTACADDEVAVPTAVLTASEIDQLADAAQAHAVEHIEAWPDVEAFIAADAEDLWGVDPTHSDIQHFDRVTSLGYWQEWANLTDYRIEVGDIFVSVDGAAYEEAWPGLWPSDINLVGLAPEVTAPKDPDGQRALEVYRFADGKVIRSDAWYPPRDNELFGWGCSAFRQAVDRYVTAWSSHDPDVIAALYADDAVFVDSMLGLAESGATAIGDLADTRFGAGEVTMNA